MVLKDIHKDIERYLKDDCYCPGEIYDASGYFCQIFDANESCKLIVKRPEHIAVICKNNIILFWIASDKIEDSVRANATEHNITEVIDYINNKKSKMMFNDKEYCNDIDKLMSFVDGIMI